MNNGYVNNYNGNGYNNNYSAPPEQNRTEPIVIGIDSAPKKGGHEKRRFGAGTIVAVLISSMVISLAAGMGGALLITSSLADGSADGNVDGGKTPRS